MKPSNVSYFHTNDDIHIFPRAQFHYVVLYLCHVALSPVLVGGIDGQLSMLGDTPVHGSEDDVRMRRFTATEL